MLARRQPDGKAKQVQVLSHLLVRQLPGHNASKPQARQERLSKRRPHAGEPLARQSPTPNRRLGNAKPLSR